MKARPATCRSNDARDSTMRQSADSCVAMNYRNWTTGGGDHACAAWPPQYPETTATRRALRRPRTGGVKVASSARRRLSGLFRIPPVRHRDGASAAEARVIVLDHAARAAAACSGAPARRRRGTCDRPPATAPVPTATAVPGATTTLHRRAPVRLPTLRCARCLAAAGGFEGDYAVACSDPTSLPLPT